MKHIKGWEEKENLPGNFKRDNDAIKYVHELLINSPHLFTRTTLYLFGLIFPV